MAIINFARWTIRGNKPTSFLSFLFILLLISCASEKKIEPFSAEKPYTIEIKKERSYFQAQKISNRLNKMDLPAYVVNTVDSTDGEWYRIMSGAMDNTDSIAAYKNRLESEFNFNNINVVEYTAYDSLIVMKPDVKEKTVSEVNTERKRIDANTPDIPKDILDIVAKYPDNNVFYLDKISILNLDEPKTLNQLDGVRLDMPRGVSVSKMAKYCTSLAETQYQDNLFDDRVTMSILKLKDDVDFEGDDPTDKKYYRVTNKFAEDILATDNYPYEDASKIHVAAWKPLYGYKVELKTKKGVDRTYYVLTDENCEYLVFSQSIEKTAKEMEEILSEIGKSEGLNNYDEFYNNFYVLPDEPEDEDIFLIYTIDKLTWRYAQSKGYQTWAKKMVGHWHVNAYFYNKSKGFWTLGLFDLLTKSNQKYIYGTLYSKDTGTGKTAQNVYGVDGFYVHSYYYYYYESWELNFGIDRYVYTINSDNSRMKKDDMLKRAEKMQFKKGGYNSNTNYASR